MSPLCYPNLKLHCINNEGILLHEITDATVILPFSYRGVWKSKIGSRLCVPTVGGLGMMPLTVGLKIVANN